MVRAGVTRSNLPTLTCWASSRSPTVFTSETLLVGLPAPSAITTVGSVRTVMATPSVKTVPSAGVTRSLRPSFTPCWASSAPTVVAAEVRWAAFDVRSRDGNGVEGRPGDLQAAQRNLARPIGGQLIVGRIAADLGESLIDGASRRPDLLLLAVDDDGEHPPAVEGDLRAVRDAGRAGRGQGVVGGHGESRSGERSVDRIGERRHLPCGPVDRNSHGLGLGGDDPATDRQGHDEGGDTDEGRRAEAMRLSSLVVPSGAAASGSGQAIWPSACVCRVFRGI